MTEPEHANLVFDTTCSVSFVLLVQSLLPDVLRDRNASSLAVQRHFGSGVADYASTA
jgi:hypothetical protein